MPKVLQQSFLVFFLSWFFLSSNLLVIFLLPKPQNEAWAFPVSATIKADPFTVILTAITDALETVGNTLKEISADVDKWMQKNELLKQALKAAWAYTRKKLLNMLVNDIVSWIQGGGTPRFVSDFPGTLEKVADQSLGLFANKLVQGNLCGAFKPTLQGLFPRAKVFFEEQVSCTASKITDNMENIWNTSFEQGGWQNWLKVQEPQNNIFGAYFIAQGELADIVARQTESKKLQIGTGAGFLGQEECSEWSVMQVNPQSGKLEASGKTINRSLAGNVSMGSENCTTALQASQQAEAYDLDLATHRGAAGDKALKITCGSQTFNEDSATLECSKKQTLTPADTIARSAGKAIGTDIDWLIGNKEEFHGYLVAIIDAVVNRVAREGLALVKHEGGSYTAGSAGGLASLKCASLTNDPTVSKDCVESQEGIKATSKDPVQIVMADRELLPQLKLELEEFSAEMDDIEAKLIKIRDLQQQIKAKENNMANAAAKISAAPTLPENPILPFWDQIAFPWYPPVEPTPPSTPDQPATCTLGAFAQKTRTPDQANQSGNVMQEAFNLILQGISQTISATSLVNVGGPVASMGSLTADRVITYTSVSVPVPVTSSVPASVCPSKKQTTTTTTTTETWASTNPPATLNFTLEISDELQETLDQISIISGQKALVEGLIGKIGYTANPPVKNDYREVLDDWYEKLGIQSGNITTDKTLFAQALAEISPHRASITTDFQNLLKSQEPEFANLITAFIAFRGSVLKKVADIELKLGSPQFPQNGGYHGKLAEIEKTGAEAALQGAANTCDMSISRVTVTVTIACEP